MSKGRDLVSEEDRQTSLIQEESYEHLSNQELLDLYKASGDYEVKWTLVLRFTELVRRIAVQTCGLYQGFTQLDDVIHEGILVLLNAVDRFDPEKGVKFETYVSKRLKGMIIDLGRKQDWLPRQLRQKSSRLNRAMEELSVQLGHTPDNKEMADYLGITRDEYEEILSDTAGANLLSLEMLLDTYGNVGNRLLASSRSSNPPEEQFEEQELLTWLRAGIETLRPNEQLVLSLYYEKELAMREIAQVMQVSSPRVSQIHSRAIQRLRLYMKKRME